MKRAGIAILSLGLLGLVVFYVQQVISQTLESPQPGQHYLVVLGDSVAAGAGLNAGGKGSDGCDLSVAAFPYLVAAQLKLTPEQLACSGATVAPRPGSSNDLLGSQYAHARPFIRGSDVLVQAGANDVDWLQTLVSCVQSTCDADSSDAKIALLQKNLTQLLKQIQVDKPRRVVVNTYYSLLNQGDTCFAQLGLTSDKIGTIIQVQNKLNTAITAAADSAKAVTVTVNFTGHLLCNTTIPYIQGLGGRAPLHPTAAGQQQIARQDAEALQIKP